MKNNFCCLAKGGLALLVSSFLLTGCNSDSSTRTGNRTTTSIEIPFALSVATAGYPNQIPGCGVDMQGLGSQGTGAKLADARFFVHDLQLITDKGESLPITLNVAAGQSIEAALLDFRDYNDCANVTDTALAVANPNRKTSILGQVAIGEDDQISHIQFTLGVPFNLNHKNQATATEPLKTPGLAAGMAWGWQAGYKFTGLDVLPSGGVTRPDDGAWSNPRWNIHLGSTGCNITATDLEQGSEQSCVSYNRPVYALALPAGLTYDQVSIELDYAALVSTSDLSQDQGAAAGCMSGGTDPECASIFEQLGLPAPGSEWDGRRTKTTVTTQSVFAVLARP